MAAPLFTSSFSNGYRRRSTLKGEESESGVGSLSESVMVGPSVAEGRVFFTELHPFPLPHPDHPFDKGYEPGKSVWLVTASCLVYSSPERCREVVTDLWGFPHFRFFDERSTDTQAMAFANDDFIVVAFRGTESKSDWETNFDYAQVPLYTSYECEGVTVHRGFNTACLSVLPPILSFIFSVGKKENPNKPLYLCGHSLGGALATLTYAHFCLGAQPVSVNGVITIGQPRVGNESFVKEMETKGPCVLQRIWNANDVVPKIPPKVEGFKHYGNRIYFDKDGAMIVDPPKSSSRRDQTLQWISGKSGVASHSRNTYITLVRNHFSKLEKERASAAVYKAVVRIHSGSNLKACDSNGFSDPFVTLTYCGTTFTSPVCQKTLNPQWDYEVVFPEVSENESLKLSVWDKDLLSNDLIGETSVPFGNCKSISQREFQLKSCEGRREVLTGDVLVSVSFYLLRDAGVIKCAKVDGFLHCGRSIKSGGRKGFFGVYAHIHSEAFETKTTVVKSHPTNPDWNFKFSIPSVSVNQLLFIDIWEKLLVKEDDFLGRASVVFRNDFQDVQAAEIPLEPREGKKEDGGYTGAPIIGSIFCSFTFGVQRNDGFKEAIGTVVIHSCRNLKAADPNGFSDPYVRMVVGGKHKCTTKVIKKTLNPAWDEEHSIGRVVAGTPITFEVWDKDLFRDEFLGVVELRFSSYTSSTREWYILSRRAGKKDVGVEGDICLSFKWLDARQFIN